MLWYYNQGPESEEYATDDYQRAIAAGAGLDVAQFDQARADPATAAKAQAAYDAATAAGFGGTPAFVVSGPGGTFPFVDGRVPTADTVIDGRQAGRGLLTRPCACASSRWPRRPSPPASAST